MGSAIWELLCVEHGITETGEATGNLLIENNNEAFFKKTNNDKYVPRGLFVDLEPTVIDEIKNGSYRNLFHPERLISGPEDAANNFARGFFTVGKLILTHVENQIRRIFESSDYVQAVIIYRSLGGGTGAGLTSALFESLSDYPKTLKIELPIYPSPRFTSSTVEPYNCLLGEHFCMEDIGLGLMVDNEALYIISTGFLHRDNPSYSSINRIIAHVISNLTASIRFQSICTSDVTVLQNNLVPYPRIHYPICNVAPLMAHGTSSFETPEVKEMTQMLFQKENQLVHIDATTGKYMSCVMFYRGNINICDVYDTLFEIKRNKSIHFVDWCPTGFKVGINLTPPSFIPDGFIAPTDKNVVMLTNTSSIGQVWQKLTHKFYLLYSKRSFVHWFIGEGMEECEFTESLYNISSLVKDYEEIVTPTDTSQFSSSKDKDINLTDIVETTGNNPYENVSLYVTMANGIPVSAPDRQSLSTKTSVIKSTYNKMSMSAEQIDEMNKMLDHKLDNKIFNLKSVIEEAPEPNDEDQGNFVNLLSSSTFENSPKDKYLEEAQFLVENGNNDIQKQITDEGLLQKDGGEKFDDILEISDNEKNDNISEKLNVLVEKLDEVFLDNGNMDDCIKFDKGSDIENDVTDENEDENMNNYDISNSPSSSDYLFDELNKLSYKKY